MDKKEVIFSEKNNKEVNSYFNTINRKTLLSVLIVSLIMELSYMILGNLMSVGSSLYSIIDISYLNVQIYNIISYLILITLVYYLFKKAPYFIGIITIGFIFFQKIAIFHLNNAATSILVVWIIMFLLFSWHYLEPRVFLPISCLSYIYLLYLLLYEDIDISSVSPYLWVMLLTMIAGLFINIANYNKNIKIFEKEKYHQKTNREKDILIKEAYEDNKIILESVDDGIIGVNKNGEIISINNGAMELLLYNKNEILGRNIKEIIGKENYTINNQSHHEIDINEYNDKVRFDNIELIKHDKTCFVAQMEYIPVHRINTELKSIIVFRDISESVIYQSRIKLLKDIAEYDIESIDDIDNLLLYSINEYMIINECQISYIIKYDSNKNIYTEKIFINRDESSPAEIIVNKSFCPQIIMQNIGYLRSGKVYINNDCYGKSYSSPNINNNKVYSIENILVYPVLEDDDMQGFVILANKKKKFDNNDISNIGIFIDSVWKKISLFNNSRELHIAKESAERVVLSSPIAIGIGDIKEKRNLVINESMKELLKINDISQYSPMDIFTSQEDKERIIKKLNNEGQVDNVQIKVNILGAEKPQTLDVLLNLQPIYYNNKECLIMTIIDLSDIKEVQRLLEAAKIEAEKAAKIKSQFLANMSHEIRTPINAIIGLNELLSNTQLTNKQKDYSNKISGSSKILLKLINDILDFSKIESGKLHIEETKFNIDNILSQVKDNVSVHAYEKDIEFILDVSENVPENIIGDPLRIEQVLLNLTNNAIKFTQQGEVILKVDCINDYENLLTLKFSVKDTGIGMTQDQAKQLFKPFTQADISTTRKYGGTGLGLVISKNLVEMMGGNIEVNTKLNRGSEFIFTAKVYKVSDVDEKTNKKIDTPECFLNANILVVIENNYTRNVFYNYLYNLGNTPKLLSCGEEAIAELRGKKYDLVIMDCKMKGLGGVESWHIIRDILGEKNVPKIIMVTAYGTQDLLEAAESEHIDQVLVKPVTQSKLYDSIIELSCDEINNEYKIKSESPKIENDITNKNIRILLVEDNEINQQVAKELLELKGYYVDLASNGKIAIDKLRLNNNYDIILMDLQMPIMDGYDATKLIRNQDEFNDIPIIALSADAMLGTKEAALNVGMDDYISKPISHQVLYDKITSLIKKSDSRELIKNKSLEIKKQELIDSLPNVNVEEGLNRINNNIDLYIKILKKFRLQYLSFVNSVTELIGKGLYEDARREVHTIKGVSATIGAIELNIIIIELEKLLKKDEINTNDLKSIIKKVELYLNDIDKEIVLIAKD